MKIAIAYFGLLRSIKKTYNSQYKRIFNVLKKNNIDYDIFCHTWKLNKTEFIQNKKVKNKINDYDYKILNSNYYKIDMQDEFKNNINMNNYFYKRVYDLKGHSKDGEWLPQLIKNHLCALESQKRVFQMIKDTNNHYDYIIIIRPDSLIECKLPIIECIDYLNNIKNGIIIPDNYYCEGYNDRFSMMNYNYSHYYCNRIDEIINYRKNNGRIVSEKYCKFICDKYYKPIFVDFRFKLIRP